VSILFDPLHIGSIEIKNRFVRSATYYGLADLDGYPSDASIELMRELVRNELGLVITGYAFVDRNGQCFADQNGIDRDEHIPAYRRMTKAVHELDGRIVMQIAHGGSASTQVDRRGDERLAVSVTDELAAKGGPIREMFEDDIGTIVEAFGHAARRVQEAGFDGVQIHGAHGYLVPQFLSPRTNRRSDRFGGSFENRMRFAIEVARATKRNVDADFPVMAKLGCRDYLDAGRGTTIEEGARVAAALEREGICLVEVSHGLAERSFLKISRGSEAVPIAEAYLRPDAEVVRRATTIPLCLVGGMRSPAVMESVVASGVVDCVALCRPLIREPDIVRRFRAGDRRPADCVSCRRCLTTDAEGRSEIRCRNREDTARLSS
jgi:2,4-dienoyl-CoA reductase-like NADH-dependent reductase (Old Yellow Enzyme family)